MFKVMENLLNLKIFLFITGIFQDHIKFLLCLATAVDVVLLGVSFSEASRGTILY